MYAGNQKKASIDESALKANRTPEALSLDKLFSFQENKTDITGTIRQETSHTNG
jgi:hypothetical protein